MEKEGEYVVTRVINYGRIIPKQELDHIFQKFYRTVIIGYLFYLKRALRCRVESALVVVGGGFLEKMW